MSYAAEDELEDDLVDVEGDGEDSSVTGEDAEIDEDIDTTTSPDADTYLLFTKPNYVPGVQFDLPGGVPVEFLVGFTNNGKDDFVVESVEASFRYPQDFNYFIQNFSAIAYNREVKPGNEATVSYAFMPSDTFAGRPFGLNIALNYRDVNGIQYSESVFNETVQIIELDEGLDGETFFLYVFLAAIVVLLLVVGQQFLVGSVGKRKRTFVTRKVETGTNNPNNIDYDWLPEETMKVIRKYFIFKSKKKKSKYLIKFFLTEKSPNSKLSPKKSPSSKVIKQSPKQQASPRQRAKRAAGSDD